MDKKDLKIVFLGTPEFAVESLDLLVTQGYNIVGVVTATDKPAGRGHKMLGSAVKQYAVAHGLKVLQPEKLKNPEFLAELASLNADLFIVIAFRMLPREVWQMPRLGTFNLHASLLPLYRGAAPINRAVMNGETVTGVTTFFLKHEIDTGDIIDRESIEITDDDNAGSVHDKLMHLGAKLALRTVQNIVAGTLTTTPQNQLLSDSITPTPAPKIFKEDCKINWNKSPREIRNYVRGLAPYPGAWTPMDVNGQLLNVKILEVAIKPDTGHVLKPGQIISSEDGRIYVGTAAGSDSVIEILQIQIPGKKPMTVGDLRNGHYNISTAAPE